MDEPDEMTYRSFHTWLAHRPIEGEDEYYISICHQGKGKHIHGPFL
jgi:hypothetical protein